MSSVTSERATFRAGWLPFALGSVPYADVRTAWNAILKRFPHVPGWLQLPRKSYLENMYTQFSEHFPGIVLQEGNIYVDRRRALEDRGLERLYLAYLDDDCEYGRIGADYAASLEALRKGEVAFAHSPLALKGQVTGPVSWGLTIVDQDQRPILYDEVLADAVSKHLCMKAAWQEQELHKLAPQTITLIDEPYMASFGSAFVGLRRNQVIGLIEGVFAGLRGLKGLHCCGDTDWSILLNTSLDILSFDAYDYSETLIRYAADVARFLERGGIIAWGIAPAGVVAKAETVGSLVERLHGIIDSLVEAGVPREAVLQSGMITPSCRLGSLAPSLADWILDLTVGVSVEMRRRYVTPDVQVVEPVAS